jgi:hypothetical protein
MLWPLPFSARLLLASWFWSAVVIVHGGTISVLMLLSFGSTSWLGCEEELLELDDELLDDPELCCEVPAPPGVSRIVLEGGCGGVVPPPEDAPPPPWQGCTATVSVCALFGTMIWFEPGGGFVLPGFTV